MAESDSTRPARPQISVDLVDELTARLRKAQAICRMVSTGSANDENGRLIHEATWAADDLIDECLKLVVDADETSRPL